MSCLDPGDDENLADLIPAVARRARAYGLEDDGASDLARRRRWARDRVAFLRQSIAELEAQPRQGMFAKVSDEKAERLLAAYRAKLPEAVEAKGEVGPAVNVVAPVVRRVQREDRRRARRSHRKG